MAMLFENIILTKYGQSLANKIQQVADKLDVPADWITMIMNTESGITHDIENGIGCVGFVQFCPNKSGSTIKTIGNQTLNVQDLKTKISPVDQLDWVYSYFAPYANKLTSFYDMYLFNFYPYAVGKPDDYIIGSQISMAAAKQIAAQNKALDVSGNGYITLKDYKKFVDKKIAAAGMNPSAVTQMGTATKILKAGKNHWIILAATGLILAVGTYLYVNRNKLF